MKSIVSTQDSLALSTNHCQLPSMLEAVQLTVVATPTVEDKSICPKSLQHLPETRRDEAWSTRLRDTESLTHGQNGPRQKATRSRWSDSGTARSSRRVNASPQQKADAWMEFWILRGLIWAWSLVVCATLDGLRVTKATTTHDGSFL